MTIANQLAFDKLIDNAATCSQEKLLVDDESLRECIKLNIYDPLLAIIDGHEAVLREMHDLKIKMSEDWPVYVNRLKDLASKRLAE